MALDGDTMNIFISGGAGFIGSHLLRRLLKGRQGQPRGDIR